MRVRLILTSLFVEGNPAFYMRVCFGKIRRERPGLRTRLLLRAPDYRDFFANRARLVYKIARIYDAE